ncbi:hypothetical protein [Tomitella biformata]|uniref:hypothetical protein n=1 Tax=Tomitella biformata TaxID=630403 RepID=UPI0004660FF2|nr:hypothetical protein [Tomitella biformata]
MNFSKPVIAAVALAAALSLTACGSSGDGGSTETTAKTTTSTSSATAAPTDGVPAMPTVDELNTKFRMALDPAVPEAEKIALVQGLEADPTLLQQLSDKVAQAEADGLVSDITVVGPLTPISAEQMSVPFTMNFNGQLTPSAVDVVVDQGEWKLAKSSICNLATLLDIASPACVTG